MVNDHPAPSDAAAAEDAALAQLLDGALAVAGVSAEADWRTNALVHLRAIAAAAALVRGPDLAEAEEPAPVFRP